MARRILTDSEGRRANAIEVDRDGEALTVSADTIIVACGAVNSALLLQRSANDRHPDGLANSSGMLGRNYVMHNNTALTRRRALQDQSNSISEDYGDKRFLFRR